MLFMRSITKFAENSQLGDEINLIYDKSIQINTFSLSLIFLGLTIRPNDFVSVVSVDGNLSHGTTERSECGWDLCVSVHME